MAWAVAFIVILGVGLPVAAWWYSGRRPPSAVNRLGTSIDRINDRIDKWLLKEYQLAPLDRGRIREAVFEGAASWTTRHWPARRISLPPRCSAEGSGACGCLP